jgi:hypothetical protein
MSTTTKPDFTAAMAQLRRIVLTSADNALTEGPVNADRLLLDLCAEALHSLVHAERSYRSRDHIITLEGKTKAEIEGWRAGNAELMDQ